MRALGERVACGRWARVSVCAVNVQGMHVPKIFVRIGAASVLDSLSLLFLWWLWSRISARLMRKR